MMGKRAVFCIVVLALMCGSCSKHEQSGSFRVEAAVINSELQILKVLRIDGAGLPITTVPATECRSMSGATLPLRSLVTWKVPEAKLIAAESSLKDGLRSLGYQMVDDFHRGVGGFQKELAEFQRDAGDGRKLKASVRVVLGPVADIEVWLAVSPSTAC